jgi:hypothetical protein
MLGKEFLAARHNPAARHASAPAGPKGIAQGLPSDWTGAIHDQHDCPLLFGVPDDFVHLLTLPAT